MKLLTKEQQQSCENAKICYICKEKFKDKYAKYKIIIKLKIIVIMQANLEVLHIAYVIWNMLYLRKFHDGSIYHYYFIIKELAEEFEGQITCLGKNTEKLKNFSVPIEKKLQEIKKETNLQKLYPVDYILLIAKDLCWAYYQILLINVLNVS